MATARSPSARSGFERERDGSPARPSAPYARTTSSGISGTSVITSYRIHYTKFYEHLHLGEHVHHRRLDLAGLGDNALDLAAAAADVLEADAVVGVLDYYVQRNNFV